MCVEGNITQEQVEIDLEPLVGQISFDELLEELRFG